MAARPPGNEAHETIMPLPRNSTQHHSLAMMHQIKYPARNHPPVSSNTTLLRRPRFSGGDRQKLTGCQYSLQPEASHNARRVDLCWPRQDGSDQNHKNLDNARAKPQQSHAHAQPQLRKPLRTVVEQPLRSTRPPRQALQPATLINNPLIASLLTSSGQRPGLQLQAHHGTRLRIKVNHFRACQLQAIVGQPGARSQSTRPREKSFQSSWFGWLGAKDTKAADDKARVAAGIRGRFSNHDR